MNSKIPELKPLLMAYAAPEADALTNHKEELWFFLDYEKALLCGERVIVGKEPVRVVDGRVLVVASAVENYLAANFAAEVVDCRRYITVDAAAAKGLHVFYNYDIGVLVFGKAPMAYKNDDKDSLRTQILRLGDLIFYDPTKEQIVKDIAKTHGELAHPAFIRHPEGWDMIRRLYVEEPKNEKEAMFRSWIVKTLEEGISHFDRFFTVNEDGSVAWKEEERLKELRHPYYLYDENGARLLFVRERTYKNEDGEIVTEKVDGSGWGDGYDYGGRKSCESAWHMPFIARAYAITKEKKYLDATYMMGLDAGEWEHWGDGHFLNCAGSASGFATAFDIVYNDLTEEQRKNFADILYHHGLRCGISSVLGNPRNDSNPSYRVYGAWGFTGRHNNWVTVCAGGMFRAACMLLSFDKYREKSLWMMEKMIACLRNCLAGYAPDGAYIESPSYWSYGTGPFVGMIADMITICGTDYGYLDTVGFKDSFKFASCIANPRREYWPFHDSGRGKMDTGMYYFAAKHFGEPSYAATRNKVLEKSGGSYADVWYYDSVSAEGASAAELDYVSYGIQTATFRSTWNEEGFHFAGLHGGASEATHGCSDAGNFYLEMDGTLWFGDPGSENYNVGNYWGWQPNGDPRYLYYRKSIEAHNLVLLLNDADVPRGQVFNTHAKPYAKIIDYKSEKGHAHMTLDMTPQFGAPCKSAKRALAMTDDRKVVVVRDEMSFKRPVSPIWVATPETQDITFSENGRVAYMTKSFEDGTKKILRASILSKDENLRFELIPEKVTLIDTIITKEKSGNQLASDSPLRLAVRATDVKKFDLSVVFEIVSEADGATSMKEKTIAKW